MYSFTYRFDNWGSGVPSTYVLISGGEWWFARSVPPSAPVIHRCGEAEDFWNWNEFLTAVLGVPVQSGRTIKMGHGVDLEPVQKLRFDV